MSGGEIRLAAALEDYFDGTSVNSQLWTIAQPNGGYPVQPVVASGLVTFDGGGLRSVQNFTNNVRVFESRARLGDPDTGFGDIGFGGSGSQPPADTTRLFLTTNNRVLQTNTRDGSVITRTNFSQFDVNQFHDYRIVARQNQTEFYVDGSLIRTDASQTMLPTWVWLFTLNIGPRIQIDWARVADYPASGSFTGCVMDAGAVVDWGSLAATAQIPGGTSLQFETRTSVDGTNWSAWSAPFSSSGGVVTSPDGRYLQYRVTLATSDSTASPQVDAVTLNFAPVAAPTATPTSTSTSAPVVTDTPTNTPVPPATETPTSTPVPPTATNTPEPTSTNTPTPTDTPAPTDTPEPTSTATPTPTE
jgi:hypothetical protein